MKNIYYIGIVLILLLFGFFIGTRLANANTIYRANGTKVDSLNYIEMWPIQYKLKKDAEIIALHLENGEVFTDADTHLYQVWYGNVKITGLILTGTMTSD